MDRLAVVDYFKMMRKDGRLQVYLQECWVLLRPCVSMQNLEDSYDVRYVHGARDPHGQQRAVARDNRQ